MPDEPDDHSLLRDYCASRAEPAFRALVERHLPAVWNAARRMVNGDAALAEDIAQEVFAHLATHAAKLPPRVVLGGWLHRHTCFTASKTIRAAVRRRIREHEHAAAMNAVSDTDPWPNIAPHLDAALNSLPAADRAAVVLRFFEKRDFRAIAAALGTSEDAARMRTARALEKLRSRLRKHSTLLTVALLTSMLAEKSLAAPPAGIAAQVVQFSLARAAAVPAAGGLAALFARLRSHRALPATVVLLSVSGYAVWQLNAWLNSGQPQAPRASSAGLPKVEPAGDGMEVAFHFILVPESAAAAIMAGRWTSDADTALLDSLLKKASHDLDGIRVACTLTGACRNGRRQKFGSTKEFPYPKDFDHGEKGMIAAREFLFRNVGTTAEIEAVIPTEGEFCDVFLSTVHHYAEPQMHHFGTSLTKPWDESLPGVKQAEFRVAETNTNLQIKPGESRLASCSQLPHLPDAPAQTPEQRLFTFITIHAPDQS